MQEPLLPPVDGQLTESELEAVVGGMSRMFVPPHLPAPPPLQPGTTTPGGFTHQHG